MEQFQIIMNRDITDCLEDGTIQDLQKLETDLAAVRQNLFSQISYNPGSTHSSWGCWRHGRKTGIKNTVTLTYHPNKFRANVENKPDVAKQHKSKIYSF